MFCIFFAPNCCDRSGKDAIIMEIEDENNYYFIAYSCASKELYLVRIVMSIFI